MRQDCKFKTCLGYTVSSRPAQETVRPGGWGDSKGVLDLQLSSEVIAQHARDPGAIPSRKAEKGRKKGKEGRKECGRILF